MAPLKSQGGGANALPTGSEKHAAVRNMFDRIAPRYDLLNRLVSLGLDQGWRRLALRLARVGPGDRVLDLACGTGDLSEQAHDLGAQVLGIDFAREMLRGASARGIDVELANGDNCQLVNNPDLYKSLEASMLQLHEAIVQFNLLIEQIREEGLF